MKKEDQIPEEDKKINPLKPEKEKIDKQQSKTFWIIGVSLLLITIGVFIFYNFKAHSKIGELQTEQAQLLSTQTNNEGVINNYMGAFNEIEATIDSIKRRQNIISINTIGSREVEIPSDKKKQIIEDVKYLNYLLERNKKQFSELNRQLSHSAGRLSEFKKKLEVLNKLIEENDKSIAELKKQLVGKDFEITQLNDKVIAMEDQIKQQTNIIGDKQILLNTAHFVIGNYQELNSKGVVNRSSGFFGLGRKTSVNNKLSDNSFTSIDMWETTTFLVGAKKAKLITTHPTDSYKWVMKGDLVESLEIINPDIFWRYTHYAVLETN